MGPDERLSLVLAVKPHHAAQRGPYRPPVVWPRELAISSPLSPMTSVGRPSSAYESNTAPPLPPASIAPPSSIRLEPVTPPSRAAAAAAVMAITLHLVRMNTDEGMSFSKN